MKNIFNKYSLIFVFFLIMFLIIPSKAYAVSYVSEKVELEKKVEFESEEFCLTLECTHFDSSPEEADSTIDGYGTTKTDSPYYFHFIISYYDLNKNYIGATDGYNKFTNSHTSNNLGNYFSSFIEPKNIIENYSVSDIKYYELFIEPSSQELVDNYLYKYEKLNPDGLDGITDQETYMMTAKVQEMPIINGEYYNNYYDSNNSYYEEQITDDSNSNYYDDYSYTNSNYDYVISNYDINMTVNENNTFDITETITAYFNVLKHGIYRKIPLKNSITRTDGTSSNNRAQISNITVDDNFTTYNENNYKVIKIGDANQTLKGEKTYIIKYTYNIGKDPLKDADELYFNLIGDQWDTEIKNVTFSINMPKSFDQSLLGFSSGKIGSTDTSNVNYTVIGNNIQGAVKNTLIPGEALTVRITLPDGYFVKAQMDTDKFTICVIIISLLFVLSAFMFWAKYGKDEQVVETVEFYPPEGYNSAELGFLYDGTATTESVISLLIYLANKGYLKIEETEEKTLFSSVNGFKITKLKEYDGSNECEKIFFKGLFDSSNSRNLNLNKVREIMDDAKSKGEKISYKDALTLAVENGARDSVTRLDLYNHFYITLDTIKSRLASKENRNKIFEPVSSGKRIWIAFMIITIFILITIKPISDFGEGGLMMLPFALIFPGIGFTVLISLGFGKTNSRLRVNGKTTNSSWAIRIFGIVWGGFFGGIPWCTIVLPCLLQNEIYFIAYIIGIICVAILIGLWKIMPKRTPYGIKILGKIRGFKRFLETAEKQQLESLVYKNPEYFYDILPYTYALGVSDKWISQFETIALQAPNWYDSRNGFSVYSFRTFMNTTMNSAANAMSSSPSSSSGGGSSGGGSSGGGSGGGGGGSW